MSTETETATQRPLFIPTAYNKVETTTILASGGMVIELSKLTLVLKHKINNVYEGWSNHRYVFVFLSQYCNELWKCIRGN